MSNRRPLRSCSWWRPRSRLGPLTSKRRRGVSWTATSAPPCSTIWRENPQRRPCPGPCPRSASSWETRSLQTHPLCVWEPASDKPGPRQRVQGQLGNKAKCQMNAMSAPWRGSAGERKQQGGQAASQRLALTPLCVLRCVRRPVRPSIAGGRGVKATDAMSTCTASDLFAPPQRPLEHSEQRIRL